MFHPVLGLWLANNVELSLIIEIDPLACETIKVHFKDWGLVDVSLIRDLDLEVDFLWLPSQVSEVLSPISRDRLCLFLDEKLLSQLLLFICPLDTVCDYLIWVMALSNIDFLVLLTLFIALSALSLLEVSWFFSYLKVKFLWFISLKFLKGWLVLGLEQQEFSSTVLDVIERRVKVDVSSLSHEISRPLILLRCIIILREYTVVFLLFI